MDIKSVASIAVQDARSMVIQPWDKSVLADIEKAIRLANIGVNPVNDGIVVRLNFPPMTEERRKQIVKIVHQLADQAKIAIRQERQVAVDLVKAITDENERDRLLKDLQKLVDAANASVETASDTKEQEVLTV